MNCPGAERGTSGGAKRAEVSPEVPKDEDVPTFLRRQAPKPELRDNVHVFIGHSARACPFFVLSCG